MVFNISQDELYKVVDYLKNIIKDKDIIVLLVGDLASGKTTLVKEYVKSLNLNCCVTSPTFAIQSIYDNNIFHYDIYNKSLKDFIALGLLEEFEKSGIHFVEWADDKLEDILKEYGFDTIKVNIIKKIDKREYIIES
jgi:tRNA threonylcarbamoyladenosine biosynthesis protein TsaE